MIITIDGPAGSGKSTTARRAADALGYVYLDTGAMYRAVALGFLRADASATPESAEAVPADLHLDVRYENDEMHVLLGEDDVSDRIRTEEVGEMASQVSSFRAVREQLVEAQQRIGREQEDLHGGVLLDGRDTGTVVFPDADLKVFMVADVEERARRRKREYAQEGKDVPLDEIQASIEARDRRDRNRDIAPLRRADDAVILDTTDRSVDEQVAFVVDRVKERRESGTWGEGL
ncbi:MAG: (d)CMP kinase [Bacteroidetes bacterium SW_9_63_38]|nr:MAG: (d)CMP kinase [Bacteroidetes bacterium SW_9_63_38]